MRGREVSEQLLTVIESALSPEAPAVLCEIYDRMAGWPGRGSVSAAKYLVNPGSGEIVALRQFRGGDLAGRRPNCLVALRCGARCPAGQELRDTRWFQTDRLRDLPLRDASPAHFLDAGELRGGQAGGSGHASSICQNG